jgi:ABC-type glycerol-3-phosphate transport system permease component
VSQVAEYPASLSGQEPGLLIPQRRHPLMHAAFGYLWASIVAVLFLLPLLWMISSSLKPNYQVLEFPPRWLPNPVQWSNYPEALTYLPFGRYALNTLLIATMTIVGHVLSCTLVAYGFARLRAPGKNALFLVVLATMMLPYPVTMIPIYIGFKSVGWVNTFLPLIVPAFFGSPFYIFLLRQFFLTLPPTWRTPPASTVPAPGRPSGASSCPSRNRPSPRWPSLLFRQPGTTFCRR